MKDAITSILAFTIAGAILGGMVGYYVGLPDRCVLIWNRFYQEQPNGTFQKVERLLIQRPGEKPTSDTELGVIAQGVAEHCWGVAAAPPPPDKPEDKP